MLVIKGSEFVPCPEGVTEGVCVDVADLGLVDGQWGPKHTIRIVWETGHKMADGRPFTVQKRYTASLNDKSNLSKDLRTWRGRAFTSEELKGFDIEKVLGAPCQLVVVHNEKDGTVYANVQAVLKAGPNKILPSGKYVRHKDRPDNQSNSKPANGHHEPEGGEEIPF